MKKRMRFAGFADRVEDLLFVRVIRSGLAMLIPILMIGASALLLRSFPVDGYGKFINSFMDGALYSLFDMIYNAAFGMLSVYMTATIAFSFARERRLYRASAFMPVTLAICCFFMLSGVRATDFNISVLGPKGMITAIISGFFAPYLFSLIYKRIERKRRLYSDGESALLSSVISSLPSAGIVIAIFAAMNLTLVRLTGSETFYALVVRLVGSLFTKNGEGFWCGLFFVFLSSLLWFFGIHGSNCLEPVMEQLFTPQITVNIAALRSGAKPIAILTKPFFDVFVLMGGCGSAMCLLLSLIIFGRRKNERRLSGIAALPMLFNINELMIFGLPVIFNPIMLIPFILTPVVCYITSYLAMYTGLVPVTTATVEWTTPIILGGCLATGSVAGGLLQAFNLALGTMIYAPFVKRLDRFKEKTAIATHEKLVDRCRELDESGDPETLIERGDRIGEAARALAPDLKDAIDSGSYELHYQPQFSFDGKCVGAEALLRMPHRLFGTLYPPLVVRLATETGLLTSLDRSIITRAFGDLAGVRKALGDDAKLSVNVTAQTFEQDGFIEFIKDLCDKYGGRGVCLEITERSAINLGLETERRIAALTEMGIKLAIDDFSMGQTSITYLKDQHFDVVKLDGELTRGILENPRCLDIISSISQLAEALGFSVIAEFVETREQRDALKSAGCNIYQGWLYSKAVKLDELAEAARKIA